MAHNVTCIHMMRFVYCHSGFLSSRLPLFCLPLCPFICLHLQNIEIFHINRIKFGLSFPNRGNPQSRCVPAPPQAPLVLLPWIPAQRVLASSIDRFIPETTLFFFFLSGNTISKSSRICNILLGIGARKACVSRALLQLLHHFFPLSFFASRWTSI